VPVSHGASDEAALMMIRKILIVQDEEVASLRQQLSAYEVTVVDSVTSACARLSKSEFDLILADVKLADGSATDLLKALSTGHNSDAQHRPLLLVILRLWVGRIRRRFAAGWGVRLFAQALFR